MVGLLLCGLATYQLLPVASLPNVHFPTIQVSAQLPGPILRRWPPQWQRRSSNR
nr:hypothetical protein [Mesorhizobium sp. AR10]